MCERGKNPQHYMLQRFIIYKSYLEQNYAAKLLYMLGLQNPMKRVLVFGTFDCLHKGHENFLQQAKSYGTRLTVVVGTDSNVLKFKHKSPRQSQDVRLKNISSLSYVDKALIGRQDLDYKKIIDEENPDIICLGYDQDRLGLEKETSIPIKRLKPYKKEKYKTSILNPKC